MRRLSPEAHARSYRVVVDSSAWITVGTLASEDYRAVLDALDRIAELASTTPVSLEGDRAAPDAILKTSVNGLEVRYVVEPDTQIVRLLGLG